MSEDSYFYEPRLGHGLPHDPFNAIIGPRPIGWISSQSAAGVLNLAPYSFFNAFAYKPPTIGFSSTGRKDTLSNVSETREFCWNLVTKPLAEQMNQSCAAVGPEVDEFVLAGLTPLASKVVKVPRVAETPVSFECRVSDIVQIKSFDGVESSNFLVLGEVVAVHIAHWLLKDGIYQTGEAHPILRGGGPADYFEIAPEALFRMRRPG